jgi:hypothetical protein
MSEECQDEAAASYEICLSYDAICGNIRGNARLIDVPQESCARARARA